MPEEEQSRYEQIQLFSSGSIPGIPGQHGPGLYTIDWQERTMTPVLPPEEPVIPIAPEEIQTPEQPQA